jgi:hypothetical protein
VAGEPIDIPHQAPNVEAHVEQTHVRFELTPNGDAGLAFDLLVPKDWAYSKSFGPVTQTLLQAQGLGFFMQSAERGSPVIGITVTRCPFEVALDVFARHLVTSEGWTVLACNWFPGPKGMFYEVTAQRIAEDKLELIRRTSVRLDHGRIFGVTCMCARAHWDAVKETFWAAHVTFALLNGTDDESSEPWKRAVAKQPDFLTVYPASWTAEQAKSKSDMRSGIHLRLIDRDGRTLLAYLLVQAERRQAGIEPSLPELVAAASGIAQKAGIQLTQDPRPIPDGEDFRAGAVDGWLAGYRCDAKLGAAEIQVRYAFVARPTVIFKFVLLSPKLEDDPLTHMRAQRTLEIARSRARTIEQ